LAERVVADVTGLPVDAVRVASLLPSGRPVVSTDTGILPLSISMAHERGLVAAAVCERAGVGIDIVDTTVVRAGLDHWLDSVERATGSPGMVWGAKEAAYKAAGLDASFRPLRVSVEPAEDGTFAWTLRDEWQTASGAGRFLNNGRFMLAVACTHAPRRTSGERPEARGPDDRFAAAAGLVTTARQSAPAIVASSERVASPGSAVHPRPSTISPQERPS
jgi:hypothetical protein